MYTALKLHPMTDEKSTLLWIACKQFNTYLFHGDRSRQAYWAKTKKPSWKQWIKVRSRFSRAAIIRRLAKGRKIYYRLARYGLSKGLFGGLRYSRNAFFVPGGLLTVRGGYIYLRLFPYTELAFEFPEGIETPYELRVYYRKREWLADFKERHD